MEASARERIVFPPASPRFGADLVEDRLEFSAIFRAQQAQRAPRRPDRETQDVEARMRDTDM